MQNSQAVLDHIEDIDWVISRAKQQLQAPNVDHAALLRIIQDASTRKFEILQIKEDD